MAGYGDDAGFAAWLAGEGITLPGSAPAPAVLRQRGSRYIDATYGARFCGSPTDGIEQERAWPRTGACAYGTEIADDVIPEAVIAASYFAAFQEATAPGSLSASIAGAKQVKRQKVGDIEREFFGGGSGDVVEDARLKLTDVEGLLAPFLDVDGGGPWMMVV